MSKKALTVTEWKCDGCGHASLQDNGKRPEGWVEQEVRVTWNHPTAVVTTGRPGRLLFRGTVCPRCLETMRKRIKEIKLRWIK